MPLTEEEARKILAGWLETPEDNIAMTGKELIEYVQFGLDCGMKPKKRKGK